jgi:hypothetical protein
MSRTTKSSSHTQPSCIDIDKMLRFSKWLFADQANKGDRSEERSSEQKSDGESAA